MKRIAVVGAGLAGLSAAIKLADEGFEVTVLEQHRSPGGRVRQVTPRCSRIPIDMGQHLMLGAYRESLALAKRLGSENHLFRVEGTTPFVSGNGKTHPYRLGKLPAPFHALPGLVGLTQLSRVERMVLVRAAAAAKLEIRRSPARLDQIDARQWLLGRGQSLNAIDGFWEPMVAATLNLPSREASAFLLATVIDKGFFGRRSDAVPVLPRTTLHDLFVAPAVTAIGAKGGRVLYQSKVSGFIQSEPGKISALHTQSGERYAADVFLLAVPSWNLGGLVKDLPRMKTTCESAETLSSSPIVNIELWFDRKWMRYPYAGFLGSSLQWIFSHQQHTNVIDEKKSYRVSTVISHAGKHLKTGSRDLIAESVAEIRRYFTEARPAQLVDGLAIKIPKATFCARPGQQSIRPACHTAYENLFLAGDWTATGLPATIESAVVSGNRAADSICLKHRLVGTNRCFNG